MSIHCTGRLDIFILADHNIALGDENGDFRPNENLTRAEITALMYRALGL
ncbi:S-layer homology domain-containing protein [Lysinibacillus sp. NPDC094403]